MKASIWDVVRSELLRLETQGKDDHRDSWMGNAIKAVNRLEEHCQKHNAYTADERAYVSSAQDAKDAARYRWLRVEGNGDNCIWSGAFIAGEVLDAEVDRLSCEGSE